MTPKDLAQIEAALDLRLPDPFRRFMQESAAELDAARRTLAGEVVLQTRPAAIIRLNRALRKHGIERGDPPAPAPWPPEYLALTDNGAGDHACVRCTTTKAAPIYTFDGEAGQFTRTFASPAAYLAHLRARVSRFRSSPRGRSDPALRRRAPALTADDAELTVPILDLPAPTATAAALRAAGVDPARLRAAYAEFLQAVTGVPRDRWPVRLATGPGKVVRLKHPRADAAAATPRPPAPFTYEGLQFYNGELSIKVRARGHDRPPAKRPPAGGLKLTPDMIDAPAAEQALADLLSATLRTPVRLAPAGKLRVKQPTRYGYAAFTRRYALVHA